MDKYVLRPYSKILPELFEKEKQRITPHLQKAVAIEHVGSTAVCNLGGKGIIDIAIAVNPEDMEATSQQLQSLGYEFRPTFSTPDRFYFVIWLPDPEEGTKRYHVHLTFPESSIWKELISFRDYLRTHSYAAEEYAAIKMRAALEANNEGPLYRKIKEPVFQKVKALVEGFILRPWHEADLDAVMRLFQNVVHTTGAKYYGTEQLSAWAPLEGLDRSAWEQSLSQNISYVVETGGTLVGFGDMTSSGHIERVYVHPKYQGKGVARMLMKKFEEEARKLNLEKLTTDASVIAMPLLRRSGYAIVQEYCKMHRGVEFTNYLMQKNLK